ncbi:MAG: hypothetical protein DMG96_02710 [Acidobacteria bacterium]|nr:MAG: hypothetical protein DMG96_02710 [Acidobacteriota bacterium]
MRVERSAEFLEALDRISELFLDGGLLNRLPTVAVENSCQEGEGGGFWLQQFPFHNAMLNLRVRKRARRKVRSFFVARSAQWPYAERSDRLRRGSLGSAPTDHGTGCTKRRFDGAAGD